MSAAPRRIPRSRLPPVANAAYLALDPERFFAHHAQRGDPFVVALPTLGEVLVSGSPEGARELFSAPPDTFAPLPVNPVEPLLGSHSLLILAGEAHRRERKLMSPPFHGDRMRAYGAIMCSRARDEVATWRRGADVVVHESMRRITLDVILRAVLGIEGEARTRDVRDAVSAMLGSYTSALLVMPALRRSLLGASPWNRFARARDRACTLFREEIARRDRSALAGREDILSLLMQATYDDGSGLTREELVDELRTLIVGGHDTTTTALVWAFFYVHRSPGPLARLKDELAPHGPEPDPEALASLPFLSAVCNEALRLHPVVPIIPRMALRPFAFRGLDVRPGEYVAVSTSLLHRRSDVWPDPTSFRPERFLERKPSPFEYAPFGGGARRCLGAAFGSFQMRMVLGSVVARASLRPVGRTAPRRVLAGITMGPASSVRMRLESVTRRA